MLRPARVSPNVTRTGWRGCTGAVRRAELPNDGSAEQRARFREAPLKFRNGVGALTETSALPGTNGPRFP
jgi:hypothetical protein